MRLAEPFYAAGEHVAIDLPGARALFTTRRGGWSSGPYDSLNLGRSTGDDPVAVQRNRESLERRLAVRFAYGRQVHGARVRRVTVAPGQRPEIATGERSGPEDADGQATALPGVAPIVLTADCVPIAIASERAVAMLHAGWRGLAAGVVAEGVSALRELGASGPLTAAIGPSAGPCCYQVGEEVHAAFAACGSAVRRGANLDLQEIARGALLRAGVAEVHGAGLCTICSDRSLFYSHRREAGLTGRQAGIAWLI